jgi:CRISPR-associated protein (TIGR02710 family)
MFNTNPDESIDRVLVCTVGGSHQPVIAAINETKKRSASIFVAFICTDRDPATTAHGSRVQVEGKGKVIKEKPTDEKPSLPNIPTQCDLEEGKFEVLIVPADDLSKVFEETRKYLTKLGKRFPKAVLAADYTGGTKTMTAGLIMAALERDDIELRLVMGSRDNLNKVDDGRSGEASVEAVRVYRSMRPFIEAWGTYGYGTAARGLNRIDLPKDEQIKGELLIATGTSEAFDAWDRFDHAKALPILKKYASRIREAGKYLTFLKILADASENRNPDAREPAHLVDLWLNAERRGVQGRYDDAVARGYRLLEWTAQWLLRTRAEIDTGNVPEGKIPEGVELTKNSKGENQAGLYAAWKLVEAHLGEELKIKIDFNRMLNHLKKRNESILAHGYCAVKEADWNEFQEYLTGFVLPILKKEGERCKFNMGDLEEKFFDLQLPTDRIWDTEGE